MQEPEPLRSRYIPTTVGEAEVTDQREVFDAKARSGDDDTSCECASWIQPNHYWLYVP